MPVVRLDTTDPWTNLAVEERLLEAIDVYGPSLMLWRNDPCVVIGRHQNPWVECDLRRMKADGVRLVRRISGGGAVYHDGGNTNFSFLAPSEHYDQGRHFAVVIAALASLGIDAHKTDRNDLRVGDRKISGNAFRHTRGRSLHHGTLLVASDLDLLTAYLTPRAALIETKATASVRSSVTNLGAARPGLTHAELWDALEAAYAAEYGPAAGERLDVVTDAPAAGRALRIDAAELARRAAELAGWEWLYGHTPAFVRSFELPSVGGAARAAVRLTVKKGRIERVEAGESPATRASYLFAALADTLVGMRYDRQALRAAAPSDETGELVRAIAEEID
ncbi:MAG: lipoate--protein ligase [Spirochaetota bacterium]